LNRFATRYGRPALLLLAVAAVTAATYFARYGIWLPTLLALGLGLLIERDTLRFLGWRESDIRLKAIAAALGGAVALNVIGKFILAPVAWAITGSAHDLSSFDFLRGNWWAVLGTLGYVWVFAAACEEIIFRGFILRYLIDAGGRSRWPVVVLAIILSSAFFGIMHSYQGPPGVLLTATFGVISSAIYLWCGRALLPVILVHGFFDTVSVFGIATNLDRAIRPIQENISRALGGSL
jgi:membrane protease YdiL (CAAX protease family)